MSTWTPLVETTRRIAGRILRTARSGHIEITDDEVQVCVSAITSKFLSTGLRQRLGIMWCRHGPDVIASGAESPKKRKPVDDSLDTLLQETHENAKLD